MRDRDRRRGERRPRRLLPKGVRPPLPKIELAAPIPEKPEVAPPAQEAVPQPTTTRPATGKDLWLVILLLIVAAVAFYPSLSGDFVWEDYPLVVDNPLVRSSADIAAVFARPFLPDRPNSYHPLATLTYLTDYQVWRLNPVGYHTTNLTLHLVATLLVYAVAVLLLARRTTAVAAGLIFAVHPVHVQSVAWISGRPQLLATCLALFAVLAYAYYVGALEDRAKAPWRAWGYYWLAVLAFTLALFAHAAAAALLALLPLYEMTFARQRARAQTGARFLLPYLGLAAGGALYLIARWWALGYRLAPGLDATAWPAHLYTFPVLAVRAIGLLLLPVKSQPYYAPTLIAGPLRADFLVAAAALIVIIILVVRLRIISAAAAFAAWWVLVALALSLNLIPVPPAAFWERDLYLPSVGIVVIIGSAFAGAGALAVKRKRSWLRAAVAAALAAAIGAGIVICWQRTAWYRDDLSLFRQMVRAAPNLAFPHFNLGNAYMDAGMYQQAAEAFRAALSLAPGSAASADALLRALEAESGRWPSGPAPSAPAGRSP